jgi:hypothetical protein
MPTELSSFETGVERVVYASEILAVARALQSGNAPRLGQSIDYYIEPEASGVAAARRSSAKPGKPYRATVEQWHLDAARLMVEEWRRENRR